MELKSRQEKRKIVVPNFYGENEHLYEDNLGWNISERQEARSNVSKHIFEHRIIEQCLNIMFYYVDNDSFYKIFGEWETLELRQPDRDYSQKYKFCQVNLDFFVYQGTLLQEFDNPADAWDGIIIDGKHLEEVLERSVILAID